MKVVVTVIGGSNVGKEFNLTQPPMDDSHYVLCEDDVLVFKVVTEEEHPCIHLALHEIFIPPNREFPPNEHQPYFEYRWEPKSIKYGDSRKESFFHNFCGLAELLVVDREQVNSETYDIEVLSRLQPVEILARKINADRINAMLNFLARNDGRDLAALARITRKHSGFKEGDKTLAFTLDRIEKYLQFFDDALPKIVRNPIVKMVSMNAIKPYTPFSNITEDSINHLISSPEGLYEVTDESESLFSIDDRHFAVDTILETEIVEDTNLYENQVLHGFVEELLTSTKNILNRLREVKVKKNASSLQGYESLFNKINQFNLRLNQPCIDRCNDYIRRLAKIKHILETHVKVSSIYVREPYFTHKAKQNLTYQKVFLMMIEWLRFGSPDWSLQNELNSLQDLSKLFEFYLFCVTKEHVLNCSRQFNGDLVASPIDGSNDNCFIFQFGNDLKAELLYEPNIFQSDELDATIPIYRNTEAWKDGYYSRGFVPTPDGRKNGFLLRVNNESTKKILRFRRSPDIILRLIGRENESILIIDAKYMTSKKAFYEEMPKCVMKYLHGIQIGATGENTSIGLMIVNPDEEDITRHFHNDEYSIFGSRTITPAIMTASIDVAKAHKFESTIQRNIFRLIEMMAFKIHLTGLGDIQINSNDLYKEDNLSLFDTESDGIDKGEISINSNDNSIESLEPITGLHLDEIEKARILTTEISLLSVESQFFVEKKSAKKVISKPKKNLDKGKSKISLSISPLFNLNKTDEDKEKSEFNPSKSFEQLRKQKHRF